jgi:transcription antitermination factor NusG
MVTFGERPVTLPEYVIETIKQQLAGWSQRQGKPVQPYQRGELIRITEGPFADMVAIFNGPSTPGKRVQVLLKVLGQLSRVWLEAQHIEKLPLSEQPAQPSVPKRPRRTRGRGRTLH